MEKLRAHIQENLNLTCKGFSKCQEYNENLHTVTIGILVLMKYFKIMNGFAWPQPMSGKKRTPHGPADPDGSQKMCHIFKYHIKMCYHLRLFP